MAASSTNETEKDPVPTSDRWKQFLGPDAGMWKNNFLFVQINASVFSRKFIFFLWFFRSAVRTSLASPRRQENRRFDAFFFQTAGPCIHKSCLKFCKLVVVFSSFLQAVIVYAECLGYPASDYTLVTAFPRRSISDLPSESSLKDAGLFPRETVIIKER